jgi:hypothetical protein
MVDMNTFLLTLYVMVDDFCKSHLPVEKRPGPKVSLCRSEVIALVIFSQWYRFRGQRDFYRMADQKLRSAFPTLPHRTQLNRLFRLHREATVAFSHHEGSAKEQPMTETLLALRNQAEPAIPSVGQPALGYYVADQGFAGDKTHREWRILYGGDVISEPQINS